MYLERRDKDDNLYAELQGLSIEMLQRFSGKVWTDYNSHDPGVTILDALNYALLELDYRLSFPFMEYLGGAGGLERAGLFPADTVFARSIVTPSDYEHLIIENIPEAEACSVSLNANMLYEFRIELKDGAAGESVKRAVEKLYHANRNLCENLGSISFGKVYSKTTRHIDAEPSCSMHRSIPALSSRNTAEYRSVQLDLPDCYGISNPVRKELPAVAAARQLQLKGYMLIFDYLLANIPMQTAAAAELAALSGFIPNIKLPAIRISDMNMLVSPERMPHSGFEQYRDKHIRKNGYFNLLDIIYGEDTRQQSDISGRVGEGEGSRQRAWLIRTLAENNNCRFRSFDILDDSPASIPVAKKIILAILGAEVDAERPAANLFSRYNLRLISDEFFFDRHKELLNVEFVFEDVDRNWEYGKIENVAVKDVEYSEQKVYMLKRRFNLFRDNVIFEGLLAYGGDPDHYRIAQLGGDDGFVLVFRHPGMNKWINMGFADNKEELTEAANILWRFIVKLNGQSNSFYLLEHILLSSENLQIGSPDSSRRLSVVLPCWTNRNYKKEERKRYEAVFTERLPAHLSIEFHWLHAEDMCRFEKIYFAWRKALAEQDNVSADRLSAEMIMLIENSRS